MQSTEELKTLMNVNPMKILELPHLHPPSPLHFLSPEWIDPRITDGGEASSATWSNNMVCTLLDAADCEKRL